jgi:hypothetical protein
MPPYVSRRAIGHWQLNWDLTVISLLGLLACGIININYSESSPPLSSGYNHRECSIRVGIVITVH